MDHIKGEKVVLCLPFMQIASGHHHVANTIIRELKTLQCQPVCYKIDILSYSYGFLEKVVSSTYLAWIKTLPRVYDWLYRRFAVQNIAQKRKYILYEMLFTPFLKQIIYDKNPHIIFCTHALPSYIISQLKIKYRLSVRTVNVYTDFFVNRIWGINGIDYHLVPTATVKKDLIERGVSQEQIFVTGIPTDQRLAQPSSRQKNGQLKILVSGGNLGVGSIRKIIFANKHCRHIHYYVLCGKNKRLYHDLKHERLPHVTPFPYISCRKKMNELYDQVDGVLTKPGGVTLNECLMKRKPTFTYYPLPGQEKINAQQLASLGLVIPIEQKGIDVEQQILNFFNSLDAREKLHERLDEYHNSLETKQLCYLLK